MPDKAGEWKTKTLSFPDRPHDTFTIRYRDPVEAIKSLFRDPDLLQLLRFAPSKVFSGPDQKNRIFSEMWTGKWWHVIQVSTRYLLVNLIDLNHIFRAFSQKVQHLHPLS
jgi:hypothetical protein